MGRRRRWIWGKSSSLQGQRRKAPIMGRKHSQETLKNLSESQKGIRHTEEAKQKLSNALSGRGNPFFGRKYDDATSRYHGVNRVNHRHKFRALITVNGKSKHLGYFDNEIEAAQAYNDYAIENGLPQPLNEL